MGIDLCVSIILMYDENKWIEWPNGWGEKEWERCINITQSGNVAQRRGESGIEGR